MRDRKWVFAVVVVALSTFPAFAQRKVDPLQYSLGDLDVKGAWIYNDMKAGFAQAKQSGRPMLVVFRCVP
jgi:serine protease Do